MTNKQKYIKRQVTELVAEKSEELAMKKVGIFKRD